LVVRKAQLIARTSVFKEHVLFDSGRSTLGRRFKGLRGVFDEVVAGIRLIGFGVDLSIYFILLYLEEFTLGR
jgi:hypothetical protein